MTLPSDDGRPSQGGICAPDELPPDSPYALGGANAVVPNSHTPGQTPSLSRLAAELHSIAADMQRLNIAWEGPASNEYGRAWSAILREVKSLRRQLEQADVLRCRRLRGLQSDWMRHRTAATAAGEQPGRPPYWWMS